MKKRGFKFVGPTIGYAWVQAVGIVNDHHIRVLLAWRAQLSQLYGRMTSPPLPRKTEVTRCIIP